MTLFFSLLLGTRAVDVTLQLRQNWPAVLVAALISHSLAEELVWRGFVFGCLRRSTTFWRAVAKSVPLIALTHVPIAVSNGLTVGLLATLTAAVTCLPLGYLWEPGGGTVWAPVLLHGLLGSWQLFERTYPVQFSLVVLVASILEFRGCIAAEPHLNGPLLAFRSFNDGHEGCVGYDADIPALTRGCGRRPQAGVGFPP